MIFQMGLSESSGRFFLNWPVSNPGEASISSEPKTNNTRYRSIETPVATLDMIAKQEGWLDSLQKFYLMKVDVEGLEPKVFRGAKQFVESGIVLNVVMELRKPNHNQEVMHMLEHLFESGYRLKMLADYNGFEVPGALENIRKVSNSSQQYAVAISMAVRSPSCQNYANLWWELSLESSQVHPA